MGKNLHHIDEIFNETQQHFRQAPPDGLWKKLESSLDKQDAEKYKRRFIIWKRMALLSLLLLGSLIIFETKIIKFKPVAPQPGNEQQAATAPSLDVKKEAPAPINLKAYNEIQASAKRELILLNHGSSKIPGKKGNPFVVENNQQALSPDYWPTVINKIAIIKPVDPGIFTDSINLVKSLTASVQAGKAVTTRSVKDGKRHNSSWELTPFVANEWAQYHLDNDNNSNSGNKAAEISKRERHESSFSAGVFVSKQLGKHVGIRTGLIYANTAIAISPQELYAARMETGAVAYKFNSSSGYGYIQPEFGLPAIGDSIRATEAQHNLQTLSVPISVLYRFQKNKFTIIPSAGILVNLITSAKIKTEVAYANNKETVNITNLDGMNKYNLGFIADVNIQYSVNNRFSVNLLPTLKYALTPITKNNLVKTFPYSVGIGAGITYKF